MGIVIGLIMLMWCLTGVVMIYVAYPSLPEPQRLAALPPLVDGPVAAPANLAGDRPINRFEVEMQGGRPILRLDDAAPQPTRDAMLATARGFDPRASLASVTQVDQWTVDGLSRQGPLYRYQLNDPAGTWLYVSGKTGKAVQIVNRSQRFWNWVGAVPHWIYPTLLRANGKLWAQVVIWLSLTGTFLTAFGLIIGLTRLRRGRLSPYRGWHLWHHLGGMIFGVLVLTWVFSGLMSMNPWGLLETVEGDEAARLAGSPPKWSVVQPAISAALANPDLAGMVSLRGASLGGQVFMVAKWLDGRTTRLNAEGRIAPLSSADRLQMAALLGGPVTLMTTEDPYYFRSTHDPAPLPVLRVIADDDQKTRYYLDPVSGGLLKKVDAAGRGYRWLHEGLHRLDFTPALRVRPIWDALMILLLSGASLVCATGVWIGVRRIRIKLHRPTRSAKT